MSEPYTRLKHKYDFFYSYINSIKANDKYKYMQAKKTNGKTDNNKNIPTE